MIVPSAASLIAPSAPAPSGAPAPPQTGGFAQELSAQIALKAQGGQRAQHRKTDTPVIGLGQISAFPIQPPQGMGAGAAAMHGLVAQGLAVAAARGLEGHASPALEIPAQAAGGALDPATARDVGQAAKAQADAGAKAQAATLAADAKSTAASRTVPAAPATEVRATVQAFSHASTIRTAAAPSEAKAAPAPANATTARFAAAEAAAAPFPGVQGSSRTTATDLRRASPAQGPSQGPKVAAVAPRIPASSPVQGAPVKGAGTTAAQPAGITGFHGESHRIVADKQSSSAVAASAQSGPLPGTNAPVGLSHEVSVQIAQAARTEVPHLQQGGASMVRIALTPPQLGHVNVTLRAGAAGVTATLTAEEPAAAAALQLGQGELRSRLESLGLGPASVKVAQEARAGVPSSRRSSAGGRR